MEKTVEQPQQRIYCIQLAPISKGKQTRDWPLLIEVRADILCKIEYGQILQFKREGQIVAEIKEPYAAWWIKEM